MNLLRVGLSELPHPYSLLADTLMTQDTTYTVSPCVRLCGLDSESGLCRGCLRTLSEITGWGKATNDERLLILADIERRRTELLQPHQGNP